jgi:segregation and condensation protein B
MELSKLKQIIEAALMAAGSALKMEQIMILFEGEEEAPTQEEVLQAIHGLMEDCAERGVELKEVSSGFRFQARQEFSQWVQRLWEEKPQRYSRALLETLALIAYRQPITRAEIEEVRGVSVSSTIIKTLQEREWVRVVGHRDVPGKPAMYATTRDFLDYFNLKSLDELPTLAEIRDIDNINAELAFEEAGEAETATAEETAADTEAAPELEGMESAEAATDVASGNGAPEAEAEPESEPEEPQEEEEFLSDDELKAIDALNQSLRANIHGKPEDEEPSGGDAEALAREERELEADLEGEAEPQEEQDTRP